MAVFDPALRLALAVEHQGLEHYQDDTILRDAVEREALRRAGVLMIEVEHGYRPGAVRAALRARLGLRASAVLALPREEPGGDAVAAHVGRRAAISAVNLQEVVKELLREGATVEAARPALDELALALHPHDEAAAYAAAALDPQTQRHGRGLGDRSCLALGLVLGLPVLTVDRAWRHVEVEGLTIELVR